MLTGKTVEQSRVCIGNIMLPDQANPAGNVHGGEIMKMMDDAAGIVAFKHARRNVVTARVDELQFHLPVQIGNLVTCNAGLTFVSKHSMEVLVTVMVEDLTKDELDKVALTAYFTMVAIDENGRPSPVPPLEVVTEEEKKLFEEGQKRYLEHKQKRVKKTEQEQL